MSRTRLFSSLALGGACCANLLLNCLVAAIAVASGPDTPPDASSQESDVRDVLEMDATPGPSSGGTTAVDVMPQDRYFQLMMAADRLYLEGDIATAEQMYRQMKLPFEAEADGKYQEPPQPFYDPALLSPRASAYWEGAQTNDPNLRSRLLVPLQLLVEEFPEFIPGHLRLAEALRLYDRNDEALVVLVQAATAYPTEPELVQTAAAALAAAEEYLEASIMVRQFALINPDRTESPEMKQLADEYYSRFRSRMRSRLRGRAIATVITGVVTVAVTGSPLGGLGALETMLLLMEGEDKLGARLAESAQEQLPMMRDAAVVDYVNNMGQELARVSGRDDFEYEFFVVEDPELNAFALPGGKVFINTGAILATDSEAELAGLVAHELAHAVLSHGLQRVTQANLFANIGRFIPFGGVLTNIAILDYSRVQERQADFLGTRILAASGYAADGLRNLMVTLRDRSGDDGGDFAWLSTHPATDDRVRYLESLILDNGYNRYAYEGVEKHAQIQARIINLTDDTGAKLRKDGAAPMPEETAMEAPESETAPENAPETPSPTP